MLKCVQLVLQGEILVDLQLGDVLLDLFFVPS